MAVDFTLTGIIDVLAQTFTNGDSQLAGLLVMLAMFLLMLVVFANIKAPITYSLVPMIIVTIIFGAIGILNTTLSFLIIIVCAVFVAAQVRGLVAGERRRWRYSAQAAAMTAYRCRSLSGVRS